MEELKTLLEERLANINEDIKRRQFKSYDSTLELKIARKDELEFVLSLIEKLQ